MTSFYYYIKASTFVNSIVIDKKMILGPVYACYQNHICCPIGISLIPWLNQTWPFYLASAESSDILFLHCKTSAATGP